MAVNPLQTNRYPPSLSYVRIPLSQCTPTQGASGGPYVM
jgi:hypothetical protein